MQARGLVVADVLDDGEPELASAAPDMVSDELGRETVDERLGEGVVIHVSHRADRDEHAMIMSICVQSMPVYRAPRSL